MPWVKAGPRSTNQMGPKARHENSVGVNISKRKEPVRMNRRALFSGVARNFVGYRTDGNDAWR
jgi:hypothetical protein